MDKKLAYSLFGVVSLMSVGANAATFDFRHEYRTGDNLDYDRFKVSQVFENNMYTALEARWLSYTPASSAMDNLVSNGHEVEVGYIYKPTDKWTFVPYFSIDSASSANSTAYKYHLKSTYKINDSFYVANRIRLAQVQNQTKSNTNYQQYDFYAGYKYGPLTLEYDFAYVDTSYSSYKNSHHTYDHNLFVGYTVNSHWTPYVELGYMPYTPTGGVYGDKWEPRYRVGVTYKM